jgi:hypothetical protein
MSDTPETDAFMTRIRGIDGDKHWVPADTAKRLERERDEARNQCKALWAMVDTEKKKAYNALRERDEWAAMCGRYKQERDEAREKNAKLEKQIEGSFTKQK